jgi:DNA (cytosine-5)-methyltransferase 1
MFTGFSFEWEFCGTLGQIQKQIGNAVPVKLSTAIAREMANYFIRKNKKDIKIASYFTGAGGLDLGFERANNEKIKFRTIFSTDIEKCVELTINKNRPDWNFFREDIQNLSPEFVLKNCGERPDIVIGGPPCQPFSVAGKQKAIHDPMGNLYKDYITHINYLRPSVIIMENVYGLAQVKAVNMIDEIYNSFNAIGYKVTHKELLAADYGTPQMRRRIFFVAAKSLDGLAFPVPTHCATPNLLDLPLYIGAGGVLGDLPMPIANR